MNKLGRFLVGFAILPASLGFIIGMAVAFAKFPAIALISVLLFGSVLLGIAVMDEGDFWQGETIA